MNPADAFATPAALPFLLLAPLVWLGLAALDAARARRLERLAGPHLETLGVAGGRGRRRARRVLFAAAFFFAGVAAAGPLLGEARGELEWEGVDIVVGLDVSRSMLAEDLSPSRLARAKREIRALAERAAGDRLGLVVFAGDARLKAPLTEDGRTFAELAELADPVDARRGGTDLGAALEVALGALDASSDTQGVIVLLTDGEDLAEAGLRVARRAREQGVRVHAIGLGTTRGSRIALADARGRAYLRDRAGAPVVSAMDAEGLQRIAEATGGTFLDASESEEPLVELYENEVLPMARAAFESKERRRRENRYQWPLLLALLLWMGDLALRVLPRVPSRLPRPLRAVAVLALLLLAACDATSEGRDAWREGRYDDARAAFDQAVARAGDDASPELLYDAALAALRAGDLEAAVRDAKRATARGGEAFEGPSAFVRGNVAFLRSQAAALDARRAVDDPRALLPALKFAEDALAAWQWAAATRPDWPEARRNVERGLLWLEQLREKRSGDRKPKPEGQDEGVPDESDVPEDAPGPPPPPLPPPPATREGDEPRTEPGPELETDDLPADEVVGLLERLREKEAQKREVRRARRQARTTEVERDW